MGDHVWAQLGRSEYVYAAVIEQRAANGDFDIRFADGDEQKRTAPSDIFKLQLTVGQNIEYGEDSEWEAWKGGVVREIKGQEHFAIWSRISHCL